jgi:plasmid maintenance system antidote protein VapI
MIDGKKYFHPGYYIEKHLNNSGIERNSFANDLGISLSELDSIIAGNQLLTADMIFKLPEKTGMMVDYWIDIQSLYLYAKSESIITRLKPYEQSERDYYEN